MFFLSILPLHHPDPFGQGMMSCYEMIGQANSSRCPLITEYGGYLARQIAAGYVESL